MRTRMVTSQTCNCAICADVTDVMYDTMLDGRWMNLCENCALAHGIDAERAIGTRLEVAKNVPSPQASPLPAIDLCEACNDLADDRELQCPNCLSKWAIEIDAYGELTCPICVQRLIVKDIFNLYYNLEIDDNELEFN
jgi:hypothetical protein